MGDSEDGLTVEFQVLFTHRNVWDAAPTVWDDQKFLNRYPDIYDLATAGHLKRLLGNCRTITLLTP